MRKTLFAGITVLSSDEAVTADNGAFIGRDRDTTDRLLELGAKTHRHTGLPGLENPPSHMGASAITSGGTIGAGQTFSLGYTLEDDQGGETLLSPIVSFTTPSPINAPFAAPAGQAKYEEGGDLPTDTYYYAYSFVDGSGGETPIGPARGVERAPGFAQAKVVLSGFTAPMSSAGAAGWRLYRAVGGGDFGFLTSGTSNNFTDDGSLNVDCDLTPLPPETNTTNGDAAFRIRLPSADVFVVESTFINLYMTNDGDFIGDALLEQFPVSSAGKEAIYASVDLDAGQPPDVNGSIGGASQIDPDTELLDWHWKRPVATSATLPSGTQGDVRLVEGEKQLFSVFASSAAGPSGWDPVGPRRAWASAITGSLASGASGVVSLELPNAVAARLLSLSTNKRARVRVYGDQAARVADAGRPFLAGAEPPGDHGVQLDYNNDSKAGGCRVRVTPLVDAANLDDPPTTRLYLSVTNFEATSAVTVAFLYLSTEAG
jgi:hypothetical protein